MEYRKLGLTGIEASTVALGCWAFAGGTPWGDQDEGQIGSAVNAEIDAGINLVDTAEAHGGGLSG